MPVTGLKTCQPREPLAEWVAGHLPRAGNDKLHCRLRLIFSLVFCISFLLAFALRPALLYGCPAVRSCPDSAKLQRMLLSAITLLIASCQPQTKRVRERERDRVKRKLPGGCCLLLPNPLSPTPCHVSLSDSSFVWDLASHNTTPPAPLQDPLRPASSVFPIDFVAAKLPPERSSRGWASRGETALNEIDNCNEPKAMISAV